MNYYLTILIIILGLQTHLADAQKSFKLLGKEGIPKEVKYKGEFLSGQQWVDNNGVNISVLSQQNTFNDQGNLIKREIFVCHYASSSGKLAFLWSLMDYQNCLGLDLTLDFREMHARVTDLDQNGITEVWLIYLKDCNGG